MADDRELDERLDRALASYVDQEPDSGLRARIMARAGETSRPNRALWIAPVAACVAALVLVFLLHPAPRAPQAIRTAAVAPDATLPRSIAIASAASLKLVSRSAALAAHRTHNSRQAVLLRNPSFPPPAPLTAEESLLLKFAAEHPEQARQVLTSTAADRAPLEIKPLTIEPIRIAALAPPRPLESEE